MALPVRSGNLDREPLLVARSDCACGAGRAHRSLSGGAAFASRRARGAYRHHVRTLRLMSAAVRTLTNMPDELQIVSFSTVQQLWSWLERHDDSHPGVWVELQKTGSNEASISFHDLLEAGIAHGWSESTRRGHTSTSFLQKFTPRRTRGTTSERNLRIAKRLEGEGRMTPAGRQALGP